MKDNRGIGTAGAFIILVVVVVLGIIGVLAFKKEDKKTPQSNATANQAPLASVVNKIKTTVPDKYQAQNVVAQDAPNYSWSMVYTVENFNPLINLQDDTSHVMLRNSNPQSPIPATVADEVIKQLKSNGFAEMSKAPVDPHVAGGDTVTATYFGRSTDICHLTIDKTTYAVTLSCAPLAQFKKVASVSRIYLQTYVDQTGARGKELMIGEPKTATTKAGDYDYTTMHIEEIKGGMAGTAYFYQKKSGDLLHFYKLSQEGLSCNSLSTPAIKAAFTDICTGSH